MLKNLVKHLKLIHIHRKYVRQACFKMRIPWQGIMHDLSKYSLAELGIAKYYAGIRSPHAVCRDKNGYSPSWIHHYHINKHHWEYWLDIVDWPDMIIAVKIPYKYVIEMFCDMIGAGKAFLGNKWACEVPWQYHQFNRKQGKILIHKASGNLLEALLLKLNNVGEEKFYSWYKENYKIIKEDYKQQQ